MKIIGICGSPRKGGNTEILIKEALKGAEEEGCKTEFIPLADKNIKHCIGCSKEECQEICKIKDDMQEFYKLLPKVDGIIIGTPVYFASPSGLMKNFVDRCRCLLRPTKKLAGKVGGIIVVGASAGHALTELILCDFLSWHDVILPGRAYAEGFARKKGEILNRKEDLEAARKLGRKIARFCKKIQ